jgi:23S rRNA (cytosine1962-C5)-methyltransferase
VSHDDATTAPTAELVLHAGRERPVRAGHPWIFSRAIVRGLDGVAPGDPVRVCAEDGTFVGVGYANPRTSIVARVLALEDVAVDAALVARRLDAALALRRMLLPDATAFRVVNGEGDRLPGMIVDRYGDVVVCQLLTAGAARLGPALVDALERTLAPRTIYERSEGAVRHEEGLPNATGVRAGASPPVPHEIEEAGARFLVDVVGGQKTGFFLDQREARARVRALARDRRVLNAFAYTGAISIAAGLGGAREVVSIDSSRPALETAEAAWGRNALPPERARWLEGNVFEYLRAERDVHDLVVLDPPPLVRRRVDLEGGLRAYKDVNLHALLRLAPGGLLLTCSCSQHVSRDAFRTAVGFAAVDARRVVRVLAEWGHPPDHPVLLAHPEGRYLKAMLLQA